MIPELNSPYRRTAALMVIVLICAPLGFAQEDAAPVDIRFDRSMTMSNLITMLSDIGGLNIIATDSVAKMNVLVQARSVSAREVLELVAEANEIKFLEKDSGIIVLLTNAEYTSGLGKSFDVRVYTLESVRVENVLSIVQTALSATGEVIANSPANQLVVMDNLQVLTSLDSMVEKIDREQHNQVVELDYLSAENAASLLRGIILPPGQVSYSPYERFVVISDTPNKVEQAIALLERMDLPKEVRTETFTLNYADSGEVGEAIRELFESRQGGMLGAGLSGIGGIGMSTTGGSYGGAEQANSQSAAGGPSTSGAQPAPPQNAAGKRVFALGQEGSVVMDERTNSVIVTAEDALIQQISAIVAAMDTRLESYNFQFQHADLATLDLETKLDGLLDSESEIYQIDLSNTSVTFFTVPAKAEQISALLRSWDVKPVQIMIDAELLSVSNDTIEEIGLNFHARNDNGTSSNGSVIEDRTGVISLAPLLGAGSALSEFSVGNILTSDYNILLRAITTDSATRIISQPRITTLNHIEALFSDSRQEPYTVVTVEGETNTVLEDVRFLDVGITLQVTPHVNALGDIRLEITLLLSTLVEIRDGVPVVATTQAQATSAMKNGQPVLLGGLELFELAKTKGRVPILSKIPILGLPFRGRKSDKTDRQLMLVVTPHVVDPPVQGEFELEIMDLHERTVGEVAED